MAKRPEIAGLEAAAKATVEDPNFCVQEADGSINYYKLGAVAGRPEVYLHVVVRDDPNGATVRTAWISRAVDLFEEFLCPPKMN